MWTRWVEWVKNANRGGFFCVAAACWGRSGLANVGQDQGDGFRIGDERDEREGRLAGGTDQREDFIDPGQEGGPPGGSGGGGIRCLPVRHLWLGSRDLGGGRGENIETGDLSG